jgi:protein-arginine kinase activator protein McsA
VKRLLEMRESVRQRYELGRTLDEQLAEAIRAENYELAATIRDKILNDKIRSPSE